MYVVIIAAVLREVRARRTVSATDTWSTQADEDTATASGRPPPAITPIGHRRRLHLQPSLISLVSRVCGYFV